MNDIYVTLSMVDTLNLILIGVLIGMLLLFLVDRLAVWTAQDTLREIDKILASSKGKDKDNV